MKNGLTLILKLPLLIALLLACQPLATVQEVKAALVVQSPTAQPLRIGDGARQLSEQDVASLELLMPGNQKPWLYWGDLDATMIPTMGAYLPPTTQTPELRRGTLITLRWPDHSPSKTWTVSESNGAYAQVAVAGRSFDQIQGDRDLHRPFKVVGDFNDTELLSIVNFLRTKYPRFVLLRGVERDGLSQILVSIGDDGVGPVRLVLGIQGQGWVILSKEIIDVRGPRRQSDNLTPLQNILRHAETAPQ